MIGLIRILLLPDKENLAYKTARQIDRQMDIKCKNETSF